MVCAKGAKKFFRPKVSCAKGAEERVDEATMEAGHRLPPTGLGGGGGKGGGLPQGSIRREGTTEAAVR